MEFKKPYITCFPLSISLDLWHSLTCVDGRLDDTKTNTIQGNITNLSCKNNPDNKRYTEKRLKPYPEASPKFTGLLNILSERLNVQERSSLGNFLFAIAFADGVFDKNEEKFLKKTFKGLGIEHLYDSMLNEFNGYAGTTQLRVGTLSGTEGERIPPERQAQKLQINEEKLKALDGETKEVQQVLHKIFEDDKDQDCSEEKQPKESISASLTAKEQHFLNIILEHSKIEREEFYSLAKENGFMTGHIVDRINTWAEDTYGDCLIYDEGDFVIEKSVTKNPQRA